MDFACYITSKFVFGGFMLCFVVGLVIGLWWKEPTKPRSRR